MYKFYLLVMGGFLGLTIVYTYAASGEVTQLPMDVAWSCTNLWSGVGILVGPFFTGNKCIQQRLISSLLLGEDLYFI